VRGGVGLVRQKEKKNLVKIPIEEMPAFLQEFSSSSFLFPYFYATGKTLNNSAMLHVLVPPTPQQQRIAERN
jgi:hypothetical protein